MRFSRMFYVLFFKSHILFLSRICQSVCDCLIFGAYVLVPNFQIFESVGLKDITLNSVILIMLHQ